MKLSVICFSGRGYRLAVRIRDGLIFHETIILYKGRRTPEGVCRTEQSLRSICEDAFETGTGLCFISAAGIAVRSIAPFVEDKLTDPPVLAADEAGRHVISLLSGHVGGANELTRRIAAVIGADPVITTATEVAVNPIVPDDFSMGRPTGPRPEGGGNSPAVKTASYILGIGCRRGKSREEIEAAVCGALETAGILMEDIRLVCTIDIKRREPGLLDFVESYYKTLLTFSAEALLRVPGEFSASELVRGHVGVDNVCERAAMAGTDAEGELILRKMVRDGVTVAIVRS